MKNTKNIKSILFALLSIVAMGFMSSCEDDVVLKKNIDQGKYDKVNYVYGSIINTVDARPNTVSELRTDNITLDLRIDLTKAFDAAIDATMKLDPALVDTYNAEHNTNFAMLPAELVSFEEDGAVLIAPGDIKSVPVTVTVKPGINLAQGKTYIVPVTTDVLTDGLRLDNLTHILLVKYVGSMPDASKTPDFKVISAVQTGDTNPLNHLSYTLKGSGKMLFDVVVLFSANIRYDDNTGKVYLHRNASISTILNNRDKYIKPLQDRGIKVALGIMGDHTVAGVANMTQSMAEEFAAELKSYCDAYNLDGVFFDDEYSDYTRFPGFVFPASTDAAARLVYETKKAMPDKLCMVYIWALTASFQKAVDGVDPGLFIDYAAADYGVNASVNSYKGITKKQLATSSQEFSPEKNNIRTAAQIRGFVAQGYGANMIFAFNPYASNYAWVQVTGLNALAEGAYNDELVDSKVRYPKEW